MTTVAPNNKKIIEISALEKKYLGMIVDMDLFLGRDEEERQVFDNMSDALLCIAIDISRERREKSKMQTLNSCSKSCSAF